MSSLDRCCPAAQLATVCGAKEDQGDQQRSGRRELAYSAISMQRTPMAQRERSPMRDRTRRRGFDGYFSAWFYLYYARSRLRPLLRSALASCTSLLFGKERRT